MVSVLTPIRARAHMSAPNFESCGTFVAITAARVLSQRLALLAPPLSLLPPQEHADVRAA